MLHQAGAPAPTATEAPTEVVAPLAATPSALAALAAPASTVEASGGVDSSTPIDVGTPAEYQVQLIRRSRPTIGTGCPLYSTFEVGGSLVGISAYLNFSLWAIFLLLLVDEPCG